MQKWVLNWGPYIHDLTVYETNCYQKKSTSCETAHQNEKNMNFSKDDLGMGFWIEHV